MKALVFDPEKTNETAGQPVTSARSTILLTVARNDNELAERCMHYGLPATAHDHGKIYGTKTNCQPNA